MVAANRLLDAGRHPPLQQDRFSHRADFLEQLEVLHVPGPDLDDVCVLHHEVQFPGVHELGDQL